MNEPDWNRANAALAALKRLNDAGHTVTEAEGVPGLFNIVGIGRDLTVGQLLDVASRLPQSPARNQPTA